MNVARPSTAPQPDLRAFIVYDRLPDGCVPLLVTDDASAPFLRPGDIAVVDATDRAPEERELFAIRWLDGTTSLVETFSREGTFGCGSNGAMIRTLCWFVAQYNRPRTIEEWAARRQKGSIITGFTDGPYATEGPNAGHLQSKLVGRLVGILAPTTEEPKRIEA